MSKGRLTEDEEIYFYKMLLWYRRHPQYAVEDILGLPNCDAPHFRITFRLAYNTRHVCGMLSRGLMKSFSIACITLVKALLESSKNELVLGPRFRQGMYVFQEAGIEKIVQNRMGSQWEESEAKTFALSSLVHPNKPINKGNNDLWKFEFRSGSQILTGPMGDKGEALLGLRAHNIWLDEARSFTQQTVDKVIRPFMNVYSNPFDKDLLAGGEENNSMAFFGTIRYTDDFYYKTIEEYQEKMEAGDKDYAVIEFNYEDSFKRVNYDGPIDSTNVSQLFKEGKLKRYYSMDVQNILQQKESGTVDLDTFLAENKNFPIQIGDRFLPIYLIKQAQEYPLNQRDPRANVLFPNEYDLLKKGVIPYSGEEAYLEPCLGHDLDCVLGFDSALSVDMQAFVLITLFSRYGYPFDAFTYVRKEKGKTYDEQAMIIRDILNRFPGCFKICGDARGGGMAVAENLREPKDKSLEPIFGVETDEKAEEMWRKGILKGRNIVHWLNTTPENNTRAGTYLKGRLQRGNLLIPTTPMATTDEETAKLYRDVDSFVTQLVRIKGIQIQGSYLKFEMPKSSNKMEDDYGEQGYKDLFSGGIYAAYALDLVTRKPIRRAAENVMPIGLKI